MNSNIFRSSLLKIRLTLFTLAIFLIVIWSLPSDAADRSPSRIVVLHSYHADFAWSDDIMKGIHKVFDKAGHNAEFYVEYMDTKRFPKQLGTEQLDSIQKYLTEKYRTLQPQVVITVDDDALRFMLDRHEAIFPRIPVVFCGVNNPVDEGKIAARKVVTGVMEVLDRKATIDAALALHPGTKKLAVITDTTTNGIGNRLLLKELAKVYEGRIKFDFLDENGTGITLDDLRSRLSKLDDETIVYYGDFFRDKNGFLDQETIIPILSKESRRPIYSPYSFVFGLGTVGGKLNSALFQGEKAAQMAMQILKGASPSQIPVIKESINRFMFDFRQMERWNIREGRLPTDSVVMYKSPSFFEQYRQLVIATLIAFIILISVIAALIVSIYRRKQAESYLRASEGRYRTLIEQMPDMIWHKDINSTYLSCNSNYAKVLGVTVETIKGHRDEDFYKPELAAKYKTDDQSVVMTGQPFETEELWEQSGETHYLQTSKVPLLDEKGAIIGTIGIGRDITERRQAEAKFQANIEDLRESQRIAHVGSWRMDVASNQVVWSEELYRMYGFDPQLPVPPYTEHQKLFTPDSWERLSAALQNTKNTGIPYDLELETLRVDGSHGWMWVYGMVLLDADGVTVGLRGMAQDITERKRTETEIKNAILFNNNIIDSAQEGIMVYDCELRYQLFNPFMEKLTGFNASDVVGKTPSDLFPFLEESGVVGDLKKVLSGEKVEPKEFQDQIRKTGRSGWVVQTNAPLMDSKGKIIGVLGIVRDITEQKRTSEQLHQAQKMESIGSLAGGVAHDFNNKLSVILGHAYLALTELPENHPIRENLEEIRKAADQSADLTRQLLAFARKQTIAPKVLDLNETVTGMLKMLNRLIGEDIHLTWQPAPDLWLLKFDPSQVDQILANLCVNARDSIFKDGKITIETGNSIIDEGYCAKHSDILPGEYVRLVVSDNGCGMDKETLNRIFEPFFTTKEAGKGTGLGLATVFGIVKQNNGFINVYSEPGIGTTFTIYLPRYAGKTGMALREGMAKIAPLGQETILLVEDELAILNMASKILTKQGYSVLQANTPAEAIRLVKEQGGMIDLLITDVIMPGMNGKDLAHNLQSMNPRLKYLYMSGYTADAIAQQGVLDEGVYFIQKPFSLPDLATKVREVLDSKAATQL